MRHIFTACLMALAVGCGDPNAGALFADIQYGTDCDVTRGCTPAPNRDICGINRGDPCPGVEGAANLSCNIEDEGTTRILTFSATQGSDFSLAVRQAVIPSAGGSAGGGSCTVTLRDGPNTHVGTCGSGTPTEAQPCQISDVRFYDDVGNPTVEGNIFCQGITNQVNPLLELELHAKGSDSMAVNSPGTFRIANCDGLTLE